MREVVDLNDSPRLQNLCRHDLRKKEYLTSQNVKIETKIAKMYFFNIFVKQEYQYN